MATEATTKYDVGGVLLDRPFKIRRLGHFGLNVREIEPMAHFYLDLLGFRRSDASGGGGFFSRYGGDHHALVIFEKEVADKQLLASPTGPAHFRPNNTINQLTFQVQSRREVVDATQYFHDRGVDVNRQGRAGGPGSNWHLYAYDPDDQIVELYYGIEQIGWDGYSKPADMRPGGQKDAYTPPHIAEYQEVQAALARGGNPTSGYRSVEALPAIYDVDGILLPRPFKVTKIGPVKLFVDDLPAAERFYRGLLGFVVTEEVVWQGEHCLFLRCDTEHHTLGLFPKACRAKLGLSAHTSAMSFGMQVANYRQLKDTVAFLREQGVRVERDRVPPELHPGIDYAAYAFDPDGHCLELYYYMEQVGWDGRVRPTSLRRPVDPHHWPASLEPLSDTYMGEPFLGPWA
jgi:catechol 2,3-dioxygenase-like lactoylglutathione lyase family enzyme